jgi:hypothetical protein
MLYESTIVSAILDTNKKPPFVMNRAITKVEPDSVTTTNFCNLGNSRYYKRCTIGEL